MVVGTVRYDAVIETPFGALGVVTARDAVQAIDLLPHPLAARRGEGLAAEVSRQLSAYLRDPAFRFDLPIAVLGTPFQRRVWQALVDIPPGQPLSYGELAQRLKTSARAVGGACRANPTPVVVPCHRVVARAGLGGFMGTTAGPGPRIKQWLLTHERQ